MNEEILKWLIGILFVVIGSFCLKKYKTIRYIPQPEPHRDHKEIHLDYGLLIGGICLILAGIFIIFSF